VGVRGGKTRGAAARGAFDQTGEPAMTGLRGRVRTRCRFRPQAGDSRDRPAHAGTADHRDSWFGAGSPGIGYCGRAYGIGRDAGAGPAGTRGPCVDAGSRRGRCSGAVGFYYAKRVVGSRGAGAVRPTPAPPACPGLCGCSPRDSVPRTRHVRLSAAAAWLVLNRIVRAHHAWAARCSWCSGAASTDFAS